MVFHAKKETPTCRNKLSKSIFCCDSRNDWSRIFFDGVLILLKICCIMKKKDMFLYNWNLF